VDAMWHILVKEPGNRELLAAILDWLEPRATAAADAGAAGGDGGGGGGRSAAAVNGEVPAAAAAAGGGGGGSSSPSRVRQRPGALDRSNPGRE
jgi:hypothetical protein